jgi:hypothetical protein
MTDRQYLVQDRGMFEKVGCAINEETEECDDDLQLREEQNAASDEAGPLQTKEWVEAGYYKVSYTTTRGAEHIFRASSATCSVVSCVDVRQV